MCKYGCSLYLQLWSGSFGVSYFAGEPGDGGGSTGGNNYGLCTNEKYYVLWHVLFHSKSSGGGSHGGSVRSLNTDALYACNTRALDAGFTNGSGGE